jgi:hypothetical protein
MVGKKMLSIDDFTPITLKDKKIFDKFYKKYPPIHSDYVFTTLISWMHYANYHFTVFEKNLIIYSKIDNQTRFRPPIGEFKKQVFDNVLKLSLEQNSDYPFGIIDEKTKKWMETIYSKFNFLEHRDFFDYVYLADDLVELKGSVYSKIRNRLNKFKRNFEYNVEEITHENFDEIREFLKRWCLWKDCGSDPFLENERKAIIFSMDNFFELKLSGILIRINNQIESIAVFEKINHNTAVVHYEKGSPDYDGIYKAINQETAKILQKEVLYINRESDMGIPGLRKAKESYRPHHMERVYHLNKEIIVF